MKKQYIIPKLKIHNIKHLTLLASSDKNFGLTKESAYKGNGQLAKDAILFDYSWDDDNQNNE